MVTALMGARITKSQVMRSYFTHKAQFWYDYRCRAGFDAYDGRE